MGYPKFFVNGYFIFPLDQTTILEELSPDMKEYLDFAFEAYEETNERERLIEDYGEDYVLDNPKFWTFDRVCDYPGVESHASIMIDELDDGRLKINFEGKFSLIGQFLEEDLRVLSKVPGVEAGLSVRPADSEITKRFKLKDGKLEVKEL